MYSRVLLKRFIMGVLLISLFASLLIGCGNQSSNSDKQTSQSQGSTPISTTQGDTGVAAEFKLPLTDKLTTLHFAGVDNWYAPASLTSGLEVWKKIEERTNVKVDWQVSGWDQYMQAMQTKLAAAVDLPDILRVPGGDPTSYGQAGLLIPMEDLIEKYAPNIKAAFEKYPEAKKMMYSGDGHLYGISPIIQESGTVMPLYWVIRQDWLDKVGMKVPETLNELYNVFVAFRDKDPNGNNKKDEIPWGGDLGALAAPFGLHLTFTAWTGGYWADKDGKVIHQYTDPRYKEYLSFLNKLYTERLIDKDYGSPTSEDAQAKVTKNLVGAMQNWPDLAGAWAKIIRDAKLQDAHYIPFSPPAGENGERSIEAYGVIDDGFHSISKDCKDPVLAIKWLDYLWSEEGKTFLAWGIEGKSYVKDGDKLKFTDFVLKNPDGLGTSDALRTLGAWPTVPWIQQGDTYRQILSSDPDFKDCWKVNEPYYVNPFPRMLATKEENDRLTALTTDMDTYISEMQTKFIIGKEPITKWDEYVKKVKDMGLDEVLKIKQEQYDNYLKR